MWLRHSPLNMEGRNLKIDLAPRNDDTLMKAVALGRQDALKLLMDRYMPVVSRTAYRILCDREESRDVAQEVFLKVWQKASRFDERHSVATWLYRITSNLSIDRLRRRRIINIFIPQSSVYEMSAPEARSPEEDYITKEAWDIFCRASENLSPKQRLVYTLRELEELPASRVGEITGMTADQIKSNLSVARRKIKAELQKYGKVR